MVTNNDDGDNDSEYSTNNKHETRFKIQFGLDEHNNEEKEDDGGGYGGRRKVNPGKEGLISIQLQKVGATYRM